MGFHLLTVLRGQSHIRKVVVLSQVSKSIFDVLLEVVPLEAELFRHVEATKSLDKNLDKQMLDNVFCSDTDPGIEH